jgi:hypothetical protein
MPIVPTSLIKRPTAILSNILMIIVISLTAHSRSLCVARRGAPAVVCEFPGGCCIKSLRLKERKKRKRKRKRNRRFDTKTQLEFCFDTPRQKNGAAVAAGGRLHVHELRRSS